MATVTCDGATRLHPGDPVAAVGPPDRPGEADHVHLLDVGSGERVAR
ncbi:hypothetical protein MO973_01020 [Paenibacillus sp. TRM 82003]|nr:hypothetical protein [Kineococcus sp. TRM81007]MCI2239443.1 hypothetical protein [Kineococcus sp. TRM81007]MCI3918813.1 hypothetical protein [Paenibacillus sp. TRM 82003]